MTHTLNTLNQVQKRLGHPPGRFSLEAAMCRCAERRAVIGQSAAALMRGDLASARQGASHVTRTMTEDAAALARRLADTARLRLLSGRQR